MAGNPQGGRPDGHCARKMTEAPYADIVIIIERHRPPAVGRDGRDMVPSVGGTSATRDPKN